MPLTRGATLGPYSVTAKIGEGGMGEVYRARDTKLDRDVALKVLPQAFTDDPDRLARFEREAKVLASLNHPNIGAIHGFEESGDTKALVLELIEGPTLADRIKQGPIPVEEALPIAKQIAEALEAAHEQGVIHRDLKPANVKVRDDGTVKVLDFGLAKAFQPEASDVSASMSPTISLTAAATQMGMIVGTAAYMAPEQAKGRLVDKRADVWAFGAVLYEMLTGQRAFGGGDVSDTLAMVLMKEVDWSPLPADTPGSVRRLLERCLAREPKQRIRDIGDVRLAMDGAFETPASAAAEPLAAPRLRLWQQPLTIAATVLAALAIGGLAVLTTIDPDVVPAGVVRFTIMPPDTAPFNFLGTYPDLVISPDGTQVVYKGTDATGSAPQLNLRPIDQVEGAPLRGGEGGLQPFVSPDGEWVGFVHYQSTRTLYKVSIFGGPPVTLTESPHSIFGASWGADDQIVFGTGGAAGAGLHRVAGGGGEPEVLTTVDAEQGELGHLWPSLIEGREAVLFVISEGNPIADGQLAVLDLANGAVTRLGLAGVSPRYVSTGHLIYAVQDGSIRAVPFETVSLTVTGNPVPLIEGVSVKPSGAANFSLSEDGRLVYALDTRGGGLTRSLVWVDREGREETIGAELRDYWAVRLAPDGERAAVAVRGGDGAEDILIYDFARDIPTRFTFDAGDDSYPVWSPDGERIVFGSTRDGTQNLFVKAADGTGEPMRLATSDVAQFSADWSPDGESLLSTENRPGTGFDITVWAMDGDPASESDILVGTEFSEYYPDLSPDGRWLAYASNESGQNEVYVRPFPDVDSGRWQVSRGGGTWPAWAPDGRELFYRRIGADEAMMVAPVDTASTFQPGNPEALFSVQNYLYGNGPRKFDVAPDGRFLMIRNSSSTSEGAASPQINVVLNWFWELTERVPVN